MRLDAERENFSARLLCAGCGQAGSAKWDKNPPGHPEGDRAVLHGVSRGFYMRVRKKLAGQPQIICERCHKVQPD